MKHRPLWLLGGALLYYLAARLGMAALSLQPSNITLLWLPSGIGLIQCVALGWRAFPAIAVASFAANLPGMLTDSLPLSILHTAVAALADAGAAIFAAAMLRRHLPAGLNRSADLVDFCLFVCLLPSAACGILLTGNLVTGGYIAARETGPLLCMLILADTIGILLVYPLYMIWQDSWERRLLITPKTIVAGLAMLVSILLAHCGYAGLIHMVLPCLLYLALAKQERAVLTLLFLVVVLVMALSSWNLGPFGVGTIREAYLMLMTYGFSITLVSLATVLYRRELETLTEAHDSWQYQAGHDNLTGLCNRRFFLPLLEDEHNRARRYHREYSLALLDLDHFKRINDKHGHQVGDQALQAVAGILRQGTREVDVLVRLGGDEFCILLPETGHPGAILAMDRLRLRFAQEGLAVDGKRIPATISIGLASLAPDDETSEQLMARADRLLYQAKRAGRNRLVADAAS